MNGIDLRGQLDELAEEYAEVAMRPARKVVNILHAETWESDSGRSLDASWLSWWRWELEFDDGSTLLQWASSMTPLDLHPINDLPWRKYVERYAPRVETRSESTKPYLAMALAAFHRENPAIMSGLLRRSGIEVPEARYRFPSWWEEWASGLPVAPPEPDISYVTAMVEATNTKGLQIYWPPNRP